MKKYKKLGILFLALGILLILIALLFPFFYKEQNVKKKKQGALEKKIEQLKTESAIYTDLELDASYQRVEDSVKRIIYRVKIHSKGPFFIEKVTLNLYGSNGQLLDRVDKKLDKIYVVGDEDTYQFETSVELDKVKEYQLVYTFMNQEYKK